MRQSPGKTARDIHPDRLVLFAAVRLAEWFDLPGKGRLRRVLLDAEGTATTDGEDSGTVNDAVRGFAARARDLVAASEEIRRSEQPDVAVALTRNVVAAGEVARPLRDAAEGTGEQRCSIEHWTLLVMVTTLVYVRARERATTTKLIAAVRDVAAEVAAL